MFSIDKIRVSKQIVVDLALIDDVCQVTALSDML